MVDFGKLVGRKFGDYTLVEKLTSGGMSFIYLGEDENLARKAAIKVLTPSLLEDDKEVAKRFQREARAIAALEHDNIITIYQYGEQDGIYFIAMRYIDGHDLSDELRELSLDSKSMKFERMLLVMEQMASALDFAHNKGVIHRDVKPSNILIDGNGKAILTDFGLVLRQEVDQTLGTAFGTPRYISPEQAMDSKLVVPQSDLYSLAVIVFEILTGEMLFTGATPMEMAVKHMTHEPKNPKEINPKIPNVVAQEVLKALQKDPVNRHLTVTEFVQALKDSFQGERRKRENSQVFQTTKFPAISDDAPTAPDPSSIDTQPMIEANLKTGALAQNKNTTKNEDKEKNKTGFPILWVGLGLVVIIVVIGLITLLGTEDIDSTSTPSSEIIETIVTETAEVAAVVTDEFDNQSTPTRTPPPTATIVPIIVQTIDMAAPTLSADDLQTATPEPQDGLVRLVYDAESFAIRNDGLNAFDLSHLRFIRGGVDAPVNTVGRILESNECLVVLHERTSNVPGEWRCENELIGQTSLESGALFWRLNDAGDESFEVQLGDQLLITCPTITRTGSNTCAFQWIFEESE